LKIQQSLANNTAIRRSTCGESKPTNKACANLEEALEDNRDFLRLAKHELWDKKSEQASSSASRLI
jgi:hypothetical protein